MSSEATLILFHRWLGVALGLMFALWFATGAVMVFVAFPSLTERDRLAHSEAIDLKRLRIGPQAAAAALGSADDLRLISIAGEPVYAARGRDGATTAVSGESGLRLGGLSPAKAADLAARFAGAPTESVTGPIDYDQWIVNQDFDSLRPFYRVRLHEPDDAELYVSSRTGEIAQRTRGYERAWNWVGSIIHWIYFVPIRRVFAVWDNLVWSVALLALATAGVGVWLGAVRSIKKMKSKRPGVSPYRGLMKWHHVLGLAAGVFVLGWIMSGWLSMDHGRLFSDGSGRDAAITYQQGSTAVSPPVPGVDQIARLGPASEIVFQRVGGFNVAAAKGRSSARTLVVTRGGPVYAATIPMSVVDAGVASAWPGAKRVAVSPVDPADAYAKAESLTADDLMVRLANAEPSRVYVDGGSGKLLVVMDGSRQAYDWLYYMLHTFNFPGLASRPVIRICVLLIPLTLGFIFSITGVLVSLRRIRLEFASR